jgi:hypothetical protein
MKLHLASNIFLPGIGEDETIDLDRQHISVRELLDHLSAISGPKNVEYVRPGSAVPDDGWEVKINDVDLLDYGGMEADLKGGDTVTVNMLVIGGG